MRRPVAMYRHVPPTERGAPEWMVSFADMVTILMAFFVVLFSLSGDQDESRQQAVLGSLRRHLGRWDDMSAFRPKPIPSLLAAPGAGGPRLQDQTGDDGAPLGPPTIKLVLPGARTAVGEGFLFQADAAGLSDEHRTRLRLVAQALAGKPQRIEVRGYAVGRSGAGDAAADGWDAAYRRARDCQQFLVAEGIEPRRIRLAVAGQLPADQDPHDRRWQGKDARVDVYQLNEFADATATPTAAETAAADTR